MPLAVSAAALVLALPVVARQSTPAANTSSYSAPPVASSPTTASAQTQQQFLQAADRVLAQMSQILHLPIKHPLKKSLRSRDQIRAYLLKEEKSDKNKSKRYADEKSLEAFGLIPKNFPFDSFMVDLLTEQVAGMYDPKAKEFYIADWIPIDEQREVMAHELTHALEDQSFHIESWINAARPNDDAENAREAVSEGSALAAMIDYSLRDSHVGVRDLPDMSLLINSGAIANISKDPTLAKAPQYIQDSLMFPYLQGTTFTQAFLKAHTGWSDLHLLFENPPVSTQQILHPQLYLAGMKPRAVALPRWKKTVPKNWKLLEENVMGEFGLQEVLKQFLGADRAEAISPAWAGDRYAVFENRSTGEIPLVFLLALDNNEDAAKFFTAYSDALARKYPSRTELSGDAQFLQFQAANGGVFLRCIADQCLDVEGASRGTFDSIDRAIGWTPAPASAAVASPRALSHGNLAALKPAQPPTALH